MGILKTRKNKKFNYTPRYYNSDKEGSPFGIEHKFDKYRNTVGNNRGWKAKFSNVVSDLRNGSDRRANRTIFIIVAIFVLIFLYIIDFDLTIFT
ncbi:MAG: riboflavin synthase subunit beta [Flavobacteriaceae bacterium]|nr:riboflavin synthase subunit beta [Flavobacteriaceae bacterium]